MRNVKLGFGGFALDTPKSLVEVRLRSLAANLDLQEISTRAPYTAIGFVEFESPGQMWIWIKAHTGVKFPREAGGPGRDIWWTIERTSEERDYSARVRSIARAIWKHVADRQV